MDSFGNFQGEWMNKLGISTSSTQLVDEVDLGSEEIVEENEIESGIGLPDWVAAEVEQLIVEPAVDVFSSEIIGGI